MKRILAPIVAAIAALLLCTSTATAQTAVDPRVKSCDALSALLNSPTSFDVGRATIVKACWSFQQGGDNYLAANLTALRALNGEQAINLMLHGSVVYPLPKDTAVTPPPVKDTVVTPPPVKDTVVVVTPPPVVAPPAATWTFCVNAGNVCLFTGLRDVRLADATGTKSVLQEWYHQVPCAVYGFQNRNPGGSALHCDYGPVKLDTLVNLHPMGALTAPVVVVPKGSRGSATADAVPDGGRYTSTPGFGSFRTTCSLAKYLHDDPIVFQDQPGKSHFHAFFGNTGVDAFSTTTSISTTGNSTCRGGILNRTAYWTPAVIDGSGKVVLPDEGTFYYKTGLGMDTKAIKPLPVGLRMIAGSPTATKRQMSPDGQQQIVNWVCLNGSASSPSDLTIPACKVGDAVRLVVIFPQCWDGKNLDSPDHKSHMAYPNYRSVYSATARDWVSACPATHPVIMPEITEHFDYPVLPGQNPLTWHLSSDMDPTKPGGLSAHADWLMGWDVATMASMITNCINAAVDCQVGGIGGRTLVSKDP